MFAQRRIMAFLSKNGNNPAQTTPLSGAIADAAQPKP
jgi:hypothetical protein